MAIQIDGKIFRNIQEQVEKNKNDIAAFSSIQFTLNNFGITVLGRVDAETDIPEGTYEYGDAYLVGTEDPYDIYIFTRDGADGEFINMGPLTVIGPQGPKGEQGDAGIITIGTVTTGAAGSNAAVTNSGTAQNAILNFVIPKGDKGDTGSQGIQGPKGETGAQGIQGVQGPQGDPGESFMIMGTITDTSQLPDPTQTPRNYAYVYKDGSQLTPDLMYFITGTVGSEVWSYASFAQIGTTVSVGGNPVSTFNADTKQDLIDSSHKLSADLTQDGSTNKVFTDTEKTKLSGIETGAQVNTVTSVNSKTGTVTLTASDVGALPSNTTFVSSVNGSSGAVTGLVPDTRTINSKPLSSNVTLTASDVGALPSNTTFVSSVNGSSGAVTGLVPDTRTINSKPLSSNVTLTASDVGAVVKLANLSTYRQAYGKSNAGIAEMINCESSSVAETLIYRDSNGRAQIEAPSADKDIANKAYVDGLTSLATIRDMIYPVGSIYMSVDNTSPATLFGGTWVALNSGNKVKIPTGDLLVDTGEVHNVSNSQALKMKDFSSGTDITSGAIGMYNGNACNYNQFPSGSAQSALSPSNLYAKTNSNVEEVYMWKRTA